MSIDAMDRDFKNALTIHQVSLADQTSETLVFRSPESIAKWFTDLKQAQFTNKED